MGKGSVGVQMESAADLTIGGTCFRWI